MSVSATTSLRPETRSEAPKRRSSGLPRRVGPYRPEAVLGSGGMATVYLATGSGRRGSRRFCALKVLHGHLHADDQHLSMFLNEARIASEINHPHVSCVFDYGCSEGRAYLAMDYLHGRSLAEVGQASAREQDPELHARRVARLLADVCEGLSAIHEHRTPSEGKLHVVHRDISPDNLILGFDGFVKVIDLGLAKIGTRGEKTQPGILKGKISYIAPELLSGAAASASADLWSLGVVAWELLTGERLFRKATDAETLRALSEQPIAAPSAVLHGLPAQLDAIVLRALRRDPAHRYATAAELSADLWVFLRSQPKLVQHRELGQWLEALFPGEHEGGLRRFESSHNQALVGLRAGRLKRSLRLVHGLQDRVGRALPTPRPAKALGMALLVAAVLALGLFRWGAAQQHGVASALAAERRDSRPQALAPGFTVEVERSPHSSEVVVHVRPAELGSTLTAAR